MHGLWVRRRGEGEGMDRGILTPSLDRGAVTRLGAVCGRAGRARRIFENVSSRVTTGYVQTENAQPSRWDQEEARPMKKVGYLWMQTEALWMGRTSGARLQKATEKCENYIKQNNVICRQKKPSKAVFIPCSR